MQDTNRKIDNYVGALDQRCYVILHTSQNKIMQLCKHFTLQEMTSHDSYT